MKLIDIKIIFLKKKIISTTLMALILCSYSSVFANSGDCTGSLFNPVTDLCWDCFFPISIGALETSGKRPDTENPTNPICHCGTNILTKWGVALGFWEPGILIDVTRHPYCIVNLDGMQVTQSKKSAEGNVTNYSSKNNHSFYYFHYIDFPMMAWLPIVTGGSCEESRNFGIAYMSELDPSWNDDSLTNILYPEILPVQQNIISAQISSAADCASSSTHLPVDSFYWSAGCHGSLYTLSGEVQEHAESIQATTLIAERGLLKLHRLGFIQDSDKDNLCEEKYTYYLPKSRYRTQLIYPKVINDCFPIGHSTALISPGIINFQISEDYGYLVWKKRNCCAY